MSNERWIKQLGRLYKEVPSDGEPTGANTNVKQFNRILGKLQEEYPSNEYIQEVEEISQSSRFNHKDDINGEVKLMCGMLADDLGYELPKEELERAGDMTSITIESNQSQTAEQNITQDISIEEVIELANHTVLNQDKQDELKSIIREFEEELSKEDPDPSTLRHFVEKAKKYSVDVAAKMSMLGLCRGLVGILGL